MFQEVSSYIIILFTVTNYSFLYSQWDHISCFRSLLPHSCPHTCAHLRY